ncbi:MAG: hypothetical protein J4452_01240 [Candidatus Aenigmarchaeota archaeon]|nr:hypothetical protein [Candidatus Aenigmarchaeota archaeon]
MKSVGKLVLFAVSLFVFVQVFTQISFAQYYPNWQSQNVPGPWGWVPQQWQWNWAPWGSWTNQQYPLILFSTNYGLPWTVNTAKCYTNVTVPIDRSTVQAGSKLTIYGRMWTSAIGYQIVNPKASIYWDGSLVSTVQGDWNGYYYASFPVSPFLYSGPHWVTVNASIDGCEPGIWTERVNVQGPVQNLPYPYQYQTNVASLWLNVTDCSNGQQLPSWAVLGNGAYAQSSVNGKILFSNIQPGDYNYWAYAGGYTTGQGSVSVSPDATSLSSTCLNRASPLPAAPQTIGIAVQGDAPPWESQSHYSTAVTPAAGISESVIIMIALAVLAGLIALGFGINHFGRKNLMRIPEQM